MPGFQPRRDVRIAFVGLFDTVVNVGLDADTGDPARARTHGLDMQLPEGCADKVVQLCALHEHRVNFPLTLAGPPHTDILVRVLPQVETAALEIFLVHGRRIGPSARLLRDVLLGDAGAQAG